MNSDLSAGACLIGIMATCLGVLGVLALSAEARKIRVHNWPLVLGACFIGAIGVWFISSACF